MLVKCTRERQRAPRDKQTQSLWPSGRQLEFPDQELLLKRSIDMVGAIQRDEGSEGPTQGLSPEGQNKSRTLNNSVFGFCLRVA